MRTRWALGLLAAVVVLLSVTAIVRRSGDTPNAGSDTAVTTGSTAPATTGKADAAGFGATPSQGPLTAYPPRTVRYYDALLPDLASPLTLYGFSPGAAAYPPTVVRLDLTSGTEVDTRLPPLRSDGAVSVLADADGVIVRPLDSVPGYRVADGAPPEILSGILGSGGPVLPGPEPSTFWAPSPIALQTSGGDELTSMRLVDEAGRDLGSGIGVSDPGATVASDGDGGIVTTGWDHTIQLQTADPSAAPIPIGAGRLVGAGPTGFVYLPCDGDRRCPLQTVSRAGVPLDAVPIPQPAGKVLAGRLSPDGTHLALIVAPDATSSSRLPGVVPQPGLEMVDLSSGQVDPRPWITTNAQAGDDALVWTPDSRWLLMITGVNTLTAMSADLQQSHTTTVNVPYLAHLALRPGS